MADPRARARPAATAAPPAAAPAARSDAARSDAARTAAAGPDAARAWLAASLPVVVLAAVVAAIVTGGRTLFEGAPPPIDEMVVERIVFRPGEIVAHVRNTGPAEATIAQVAVNEALWPATVTPGPALPRFGRAAITLPLHWVEGEPYTVTVITSTGLKFEGVVNQAFLTPSPSARTLLSFALIGTYVGVIPVLLGLVWYPFLRRMGAAWYHFLLSFTVGLLAFLGVDTLQEALETAAELPAAFHAVSLVAIGAAASFLGLVAIGHRVGNHGRAAPGAPPPRLVLAYLIAAGIGLHNLGEGLAIGAAYSLGEAALGVFLILGFTLHNTTEGLAIVAPLTREPLPAGRMLRHLVLLGIIGGAPTIAGAWIGGLTYAKPLSVLFLGLGAGAIAQVVYEVGKVVHDETGRVFADLPSLAGLLAGLAVMYGTGLLVAA